VRVLLQRRTRGKPNLMFIMIQSSASDNNLEPTVEGSRLRARLQVLGKNWMHWCSFTAAKLKPASKSRLATRLVVDGASRCTLYQIDASSRYSSYRNQKMGCRSIIFWKSRNFAARSIVAAVASISSGRGCSRARQTKVTFFIAN